MFIYHARQRSKFSISYHVQSRHSPRIDLGFQCFSRLTLWFPGCPSIHLKDQQVTTWIRHRWLQNRYWEEFFAVWKVKVFTRPSFSTSKHRAFDCARCCQCPAASTWERFVSWPLDTCTRRSTDVIDLTDGLIELPIWSRYGLLEMPCLGQGWIRAKAFGECEAAVYGKGDWWYHFFSPYRTIQLLPCCLDWNSMTGLRGGFAKQHLNARRLF